MHDLTDCAVGMVKEVRMMMEDNMAIDKKDAAS
jgi:hypothetical protein